MGRKPAKSRPTNDRVNITELTYKVVGKKGNAYYVPGHTYNWSVLLLNKYNHRIMSFTVALVTNSRQEALEYVNHNNQTKALG